MRRILILHGWQGSQAPHWQAWLAETLQELGFEVAFPQLSNNKKPQKELWMKETKELLKTFHPDSVIAHSMGNTLWFHLCNEGLIKPVEHLLLVAPPRDLSEYEDVKSFFPLQTPAKPFARDVLMVCSDNDPYMEINESQALAKHLGCRLKVLESAGHINADSGYGAWPWVLEWIKNQ